MTIRRRTVAFLALGAAFVVAAASLTLAVMGVVDGRPAGAGMLFLAGYAGTTTIILIASRRSRWGRPAWLLLGSICLFGASALLHNLIYGLTGIEDAVTLLLAAWVAPCLLIAGVARLLGHLRPRGGAASAPPGRAVTG